MAECCLQLLVGRSGPDNALEHSVREGSGVRRAVAQHAGIERPEAIRRQLLVQVDVQPALVVKSLSPCLILRWALLRSHGLDVVALLPQPAVARLALLLQPDDSLRPVSSGLPP